MGVGSPRRERASAVSVDREEVERIGRLAKLRLTDDEAERLTDEMNRILEHAERLRRLEEASGAGPVIEGGAAGSGQAAEREAAEREADEGEADEGEADERGVGGEGPDVARTTDPGGPGPSGTRSPAAETPDPLHMAPSAFAPDVREGFFVVPPPPGVVADNHGAHGREDARAADDDPGGREK